MRKTLALVCCAGLLAACGSDDAAPSEDGTQTSVTSGDTTTGTDDTTGTGETTGTEDTTGTGDTTGAEDTTSGTDDTATAAGTGGGDDTSASSTGGADTGTDDGGDTGGCTPQCTDKECGDDGCGGLCNGCLDLVQDDGTAETAWGYNEDPGFSPSAVGCFVRFDLPQPGMKLTQFSAVWLTGLVNMAVPFDLVIASGDAVTCEPGVEGEDWYIDYCAFDASAATVVATDLLPKGDLAVHGVDELGDITLEGTTVFVGAVFDVTEYPIFPCPLDQGSGGTNSFMMPLSGEPAEYDAAALETWDANKGAIPLRIRTQLH